ncbi:hypothetical protein D6K54_27430 [Salmonella enterica subsp. enterica]|uniref:Uncharacterized protein n=1 Tax=Salmonella enterica subsp. enterica serovar Java TaxID=224729 RepID=A0A3Z6QTT1_SALEB|nr:hypothetical protein [Salmonella enterica subsp. enterica serovar Java]
MASIILLRIDNMSFEQMRIIEHRLKTGLRVLMRNAQKKIRINKRPGLNEVSEPFKEIQYSQSMRGEL